MSTYYFKIMMLWQSEEEPQSFWDLDVEFLIDWLISRMIHWIRSKQFPHYFIRSNNLLDHVRDTSREVRMLEELKISMLDSILKRYENCVECFGATDWSDTFHCIQINSIPIQYCWSEP